MKHPDCVRWTMGLVLLAAAALANGSHAKDLVLTRSAKSGVDGIIAYERAWDRDCHPRASSVAFTRQPAHGTISIVQGDSIVPSSTPRSGSTGKCAGQSIVGNEIHYLSSPGFHGVDHVSWTVRYDTREGGGSTDIDIVVK